MMTQHQLKENVKIMALVAERDDAMHERNIALAEKRAAIAERDMAILQRDTAIAERNNAIMERDNALAALHYARENGVNGNCMTESSPSARGTKHSHQQQQLQQQHHLQHLQTQSPYPDGHYNDTRDMHITEAFPSSTDSDVIMKSQKAKRQIKESKVQASPSKKPSKSPRKSRKNGGEDLNKQVTIAKSTSDWRDEVVGDDLNKHASRTNYYGWKGQDLGLNQVMFDELAMPVPVCSCTGKYRQCYKWGNGGWQSSCCTTTMSMYPLPVMPNKRHARMNGRKMSGSAFKKLLIRLAAEGYDLSMPVDLKDHWAKHGTNRYITIK